MDEWIKKEIKWLESLIYETIEIILNNTGWK